MGLQIRLRHALGDRLAELPERAAESPIVVGRAREAAIKIPSTSVAAQHCVLFVQDGQWAVRDLSGGATFVNDQPAGDFTALNIGDVIIVGNDADAAQIEIDPARAAAGQTGLPAKGTVAAAPRPSVSRPAPAAPKLGVPGGPSGLPSPRKAPLSAASPISTPPAAPARPPQIVPSGARPIQSARPGAAMPQALPAAVAHAEPDPVADDPWAALGQASASTSAATAAAPAAVRKKAKKASGAPLFIGILVCVGICAGVIYAFVNFNSKPKVVIVEAPSKPKTQFEYKSDNMFGIGGSYVAKSDPEMGHTDRNAPKAAPTPAPAPETPAPSPEPAPAPTPTPKPAAPKENPDDPVASSVNGAADSHAGDAAWLDIQAAMQGSDGGIAIIKIDDYVRSHPSSPSMKELTGFIDECMNRIWWDRIRMLCDRRSKLEKDLRAKDKELAQQPAGDFHKILEGERKAIEKEMALVQEHFTEMHFTGTDAPNPDDKAAMAKAVGERDAGTFEDWKKRTLKYIRVGHGKLPWDNET